MPREAVSSFSRAISWGDVGLRKNGLEGFGAAAEIGFGLVGLALGFGGLEETFGGGHGFVVLGEAALLFGAESGEVLFEAAGDALLVETQKRKIAGFGEPGGGVGEGGFDFGMVGSGAGVIGGEGHGEDRVFEGGGALETPLGIGDGLDEFLFDGADGAVMNLSSEQWRS